MAELGKILYKKIYLKTVEVINIDVQIKNLYCA
jgi:hypothetical protein